MTTTIDPLPAHPDPGDNKSTFSAKMFAFLAAMNPFRAQVNTVAGEVNANALAAAVAQGLAEAARDLADIYRLAAAASASAAANSAGAALWVSGNYNQGASAKSGINYRVYNARTTGAKPTDPSLDLTNWQLAAGSDLQDIEVSGTTATAAVNGRYWLLNAGATTLTAPPSPQPNDCFAVKGANNLVTNLIDWNGAKHEGISDATMKLNVKNGSWKFIYRNATFGWGIVV